MGQLTILQSYWSLPYFGNRPNKFELVHQTISCQDVGEIFGHTEMQEFLTFNSPEMRFLVARQWQLPQQKVLQMPG